MWCVPALFRAALAQDDTLLLCQALFVGSPLIRGILEVHLSMVGVQCQCPRLFGASGAAASPFVLSVQEAGIKGIPDLINACMIIGIVAIALESIYLPSRMLRTMAIQGLIPSWIGHCDVQGRPRWALVRTRENAHFSHHAWHGAKK